MSISYQPLDLETERLVASLVLQDLEEIQEAQKGKSRADAPITDDQMALRDQLAAIMSHMTILEDIHIAQNLDNALHLDRDCLEALSIVNQAEADDRNAALALGRGEALPSPSAAQISLQDPSVSAQLSVLFRDTQNLTDPIIRNFRGHSPEASIVILSSPELHGADSVVNLAPSMSGSSTSLRYALPYILKPLKTNYHPTLIAQE